MFFELLREARANMAAPAKTPLAVPSRTVVARTPGVTAAGMELVGFPDGVLDIDARHAAAASSVVAERPDPQLPAPTVVRWALTDRGAHGLRRAFCQVAVARHPIDQSLEEALRHDWHRANGQPPGAADLLLIRQAIADAWRHREELAPLR